MIYFDNKSKIYLKENYNFIHKIIKKKEIILFKKIIKSLIYKKKIDILDIGSGVGTYTKLLTIKSCTITCIDSSKKMLDKITNKKIRKIHTNFLKFKKSRKYDLILSLGVIEFVKDYTIFLKKVTHISKKNTSVIFLLPGNNLLSFFYKLYHTISGNKIYLHNLDNIISVLEKLGWTIIYKKKIVFFSTFLVAKFKFLKKT